MKVLSNFFRLVFLAVAVSGMNAQAQQINDTNTVGLPAFGSFGGSSFDSVQLQNGNLHVQIPILSVPQRGGRTFTWKFIYDTPTWQGVWFPNPIPTDPNNGIYRILPMDPGSEDAGWRLTNSLRQILLYSLMETKCPTGSTAGGTYRGNYRIIDPEGTIHSFGLRVGGGSGAPTTFCQPQFLASPATDGSGIFWDAQSGIVRLKDGSQLAIDTNGNQFTSSADTLNRNLVMIADAATTSYTTPLGHTVTGPSYTTWTVKDPSGNNQIYRLDYSAFDNLTNYCSTLPHGTYPCYEYQIPDLRVTKLTLPNGKFYQFTWTNNSVFELTRIDLPTGASIAYTYGVLKQSQPIPPSSPAPLHHTWATWNIRKTIATRTVTNGSQNFQWQYNIATSLCTVTNPDGSTEEHTLQKVPIGQTVQSANRVETQVVYKDSSGNALRTVQSDWAGESGIAAIAALENLRIIRQTTTLDSSQVSKVETDYDTFNYSVTAGQYLPGCTACTATRSDVKERREYDFSGNLARKTTTDYLHIAGPNAATYTSLNIVDRPTSVIVYDGAANPASKTQYEYDVYTNPITASSAVQHSSSYGIAYTTRGNVTATSLWRNTDGTWFTTRNQYDDAGNIISKTDPLNHTTTYNFTDSWIATAGTTGGNACAPSGQGKAYPTTVTNALNQSTTISYYSCSGTIGSATDPNSKTTWTKYDLLGRSLEIHNPDGGLVTHCYTDVGGSSCTAGGPPFTIASTVVINGSTNLVTTSVFDGLGQKNRTQLNSDPDLPTFTDTTYDEFGRARTVSNPYRSTPASTDGTTTNFYDSLGRICLVVPPDGTLPSGNGCPTTQPANTVLTSYFGTTATVTDQQGKSRKTVTDALGRIVQVFEDPNGLNYETDYTYDVLDNLKTVSQKGGSATSTNWRARTFSYNSLSQLTSATNPESGTISYVYDADGNLTTKTAPKPNQTGSATIVTTYSYDALHRLTQKSYNDGSTPTVKYGYDAVALSGCVVAPPTITVNNGIGKRTAMCDGAGSEAWSYDVVSGTGWKTTDVRITNAVTKTIVTQSNLDGSLYQLSYPATEVLTYAPSGSGRPTSAIGSSTYATNVHYAPSGAICNFQTLWGNTFTHNYTYNNRLQPIRMQVFGTGFGSTPGPCQASSDTNAANLNLTYNYLDSNNHNNGNVMSVTNVLSSPRSQSFTYDSLNRLSTAQTTSTFATSAANCWAETYTYDPWGNLYTYGLNTSTQAAYVGCTQESGLSSTPTTSNRLNSFSYDAAGNLTNDNVGGVYSYDGENRLRTAGGITYFYDGDGNRVAKAPSATPTQPNWIYWYGPDGNLLDETNGSGTFQFRHYYFNGMRIARREPNNFVDHYALDALGNARFVYGNNGTDVSDYYPFGGERVIQSAAGNHFKFTGKERDAETGLDNFINRYHESSMGRFMSPDSLGFYAASPTVPQSWNFYSYVLNNPLNLVDPTGLWCVWADNTHDDTPEEGGATEKECGEQGGHWDPTNTITGMDAAGNLMQEIQVEGNLTDDDRIKIVAAGVDSLTTTSSIAEVAQKGMEGATLVEGIAELPLAVRSAWNLGKELLSPKVLKGPAEYAARSLAEQLAMQEAKNAGKIIIKDLGDEGRLVSNYGPGRWVKMQYVHDGADGSKVTVHYFKNLVTNQQVEFKVVYNSAIK